MQPLLKQSPSQPLGPESRNAPRPQRCVTPARAAAKETTLSLRELAEFSLPTSDKGGTVKLGGSWISATEHCELNVTGVLRGLCNVTT